MAKLCEPVVVDDTARPVLRVDGEEAARFVHGFCTADVVGLAVGQSREAFFTTIKGRVLSYGVLTRTPDGVTVELLDRSAEPLREHLAKYAAIEPVSVKVVPATPRRLVIGPGAAELAGEGGRRWPFAGEEIIVVEGDTPKVTADAIAWDRARIRCGIPLVGVDVTDKSIVQEAARTTQAVSFEKGCYLGQEPIARLDAMGHTNKELRVLRFEGAVDVAPGEAVFFDGQPAGDVRSVVTGEDETLAIAMLRTAANAAAAVVHAGGHEAVVSLPV